MTLRCPRIGRERPTGIGVRNALSIFTAVLRPTHEPDRVDAVDHDQQDRRDVDGPVEATPEISPATAGERLDCEQADQRQQDELRDGAQVDGAFTRAGRRSTAARCSLGMIVI